MSTTETLRPHSIGLDTRDDEGVITALVEGQERAIAAVATARPALAAAAGAVVSRLSSGTGRIIYVGAGSSGLIAALDGMELAGTFGWPEARTLFILANGHVLEPGLPGGHEDDGERGRAEMVVHKPSPADVVIAVAASGRTPFTLAATAAAREAGALTVGLTNNAEAPLLGRVDFPVLLDTGPEVISGSTRLGAGTAQKAALGILSTLVFIRLGHVHDGLMVSLRIDNEKLRRRAIGIVMHIGGCDEAAAVAALAAAGDHVKSAVLVARGATPEQARRLLTATADNLRRAMALLEASGAAKSRAGAPPVA
jgi:N-acetylmuramic acid 6-phosphate etherase